MFTASINRDSELHSIKAQTQMDSNTAIQTLQSEITWLTHVINQMIASYLEHEGHEKNWHDILPPDLSSEATPYANKVNEWQLNVYERLALALAMAPHIQPEELDIFFGKNLWYDIGFK